MVSIKPIGLLIVCLVLTASSILTAAPGEGKDSTKPWTFVSIPDFLNVDTVYPEPEWEDALSFTIQSVKAENPDFVLVPWDLVMGHWDYLGNRLDTGKKVEGEAGVRYWASPYYPA